MESIEGKQLSCVVRLTRMYTTSVLISVAVPDSSYAYFGGAGALLDQYTLYDTVVEGDIVDCLYSFADTILIKALLN